MALVHGSPSKVSYTWSIGMGLISTAVLLSRRLLLVSLEATGRTNSSCHEQRDDLVVVVVAVLGGAFSNGKGLAAPGSSLGRTRIRLQ